MAIRQVCDVFGTPNKLKHYDAVIIERAISETADGQAEISDIAELPPPVEILRLNGVLCPRAADRLLKKIKAGFLPPVKRKDASKEATDPQQAPPQSPVAAKPKKRKGKNDE